MQKTLDTIFVVALLAAKHVAFAKDRPHVECEPWAVIANSLESAEALGFKQALERWPKESGWTFHAAHASRLVIHVSTDSEKQDEHLTVDLVM